MERELIVDCEMRQSPDSRSWSANLSPRPCCCEVIPGYSGNIGADVLVLAAETQDETEIGEKARGEEGGTGVRVICEAPQGCCQLHQEQGQDRKQVKERAGAAATTPLTLLRDGLCANSCSS